MHLIYTSSTPLATLRHLAQDFPKYATFLSRRVGVLGEGEDNGVSGVDGDLIDEVVANHGKAAPGTNIVWLNGAVVREEDMNPFA